MENLEIIFKNKKNRIIAICFIIVLIVGIILFIESEKNGEETIDVLEKVDEGTRQINNQIDNKSRMIGDNQIGNIEISENIKEDQEEIIAIHITGEVKKTGILYLEKGARIVDAIEAAGGTKKNANLNGVNLAYVLEDGQKIYIPSKKEKFEQGTYIASNSGQNVLVEESKSKNGSEAINKKQKGVNGKVNINSANQTELETLQGIGPSLAERIIEYRQSNGRFEKIEDIQNVKGIGNSKYSNIKDNICI